MDFTEAELFTNLLEIKDEFIHLDLHNHFTCVDVKYLSEILEMKFQNNKSQGYITLQFKQVVILKMILPLRNLTIDNFHRGRYELDGKLYDEYQGKKCFYIEFYEGGSVELLCSKAVLQMPNAKLN